MRYEKFSVIVLIAFLSICGGHSNGMHSLKDSRPKFYCGRNLARMLAAICFDVENDKRSEGTMYNAILTPLYNDNEKELDWPWLTPHKARNINIPIPINKRFIVTECCDKPCSISELLSYC